MNLENTSNICDFPEKATKEELVALGAEEEWPGYMAYKNPKLKVIAGWVRSDDSNEKYERIYTGIVDTGTIH
jgi:hypothetical protein